MSAFAVSQSPKWYYYLQNDPRGNPDGWYEYDFHVNQTVEQLHQTHQQQHQTLSTAAAASSRSRHHLSPSKRGRRLVPLMASSGYQYELDFQRMTQRNVTSRKERPIARTTNGVPPVLPPHGVVPPPPPHQQQQQQNAAGWGFPFGSSNVAASFPVPIGGPAAVTANYASTSGSGFGGLPAGISAAFGIVFGSAAAATIIPNTDTATTAIRPGVQATRSLMGGVDELQYTAPDVLHQVHIDDKEVFTDVAPPTGKPAATTTTTGNGEGKKQADANGSSNHYSSSNHDDECAICLDMLWADGGNRVVSLNGCLHQFHYDCIHEALKKGGGKCSLCLRSVLKDQDNKTCKGQCPSGTMTVTTTNRRKCQSFEHAGTIEITYRIPSGTQMSYHPEPGAHFSGATRTAYLPDTAEGRDLLARMQYAFCHGLSFRVGTSLTTSQPNVVTWASIHHKTSPSGGAYGYPDDTYFTRCNDEMNQLGIPPPGECRCWLSNL